MDTEIITVEGPKGTLSFDGDMVYFRDHGRKVISIPVDEITRVIHHEAGRVGDGKIRFQTPSKKFFGGFTYPRTVGLPTKKRRGKNGQAALELVAAVEDARRRRSSRTEDES